MIEIKQTPDPVLRALAPDVDSKLFGGAELNKILSDMSQALCEQHDGVAIAAPQIGVSLRIFVIAGSVFSRNKRLAKPEPDRVFINPVFTRLSKTTKWMDGEGCLSVRWKYGKTKRHTSLTVHAYNERGEVFDFTARGLMAHIVQHEVDHLNGVLFIDHAEDVHDLPPQE